eukprot:477629-Amorphochlora_amoeboformis.AAC.1
MSKGTSDTEGFGSISIAAISATATGLFRFKTELRELKTYLKMLIGLTRSHHEKATSDFHFGGQVARTIKVRQADFKSRGQYEV